MYGIQNTRSMRMDPHPPAEFVMMDKPTVKRSGLQLLPIFSGESFNRAVAYQVIVEMWEKSKFGRVKRAFHSQFTEKERRKIGRYHGRFYRWMMVTGTPHKVALRLNTLHLLQRAVAFFASV